MNELNAALQDACRPPAQNLEVIRDLLTQGADANSVDLTDIISEAFTFGNERIQLLEMLLSTGANPDQKDGAPLRKTLGSQHSSHDPESNLTLDLLLRYNRRK